MVEQVGEQPEQQQKHQKKMSLHQRLSRLKEVTAVVVTAVIKRGKPARGGGGEKKVR